MRQDELEPEQLKPDQIISRVNQISLYIKIDSLCSIEWVFSQWASSQLKSIDIFKLMKEDLIYSSAKYKIFKYKNGEASL